MTWLQSHRILGGAVLLLVVLTSFSWSTLNVSAESVSKENSASTSSGQIAELLKQAEIHFQQQELSTSLALYLRVLNLIPHHETARAQVYEITTIYKTLAEISEQDGKNEQATLYYQNYRDAVRDILQLLTTQLESAIKHYGQLLQLEKQGQTIDDEVLPALDRIILILQDLSMMYEQFPRDNVEAQKMHERLHLAIQKYEQERSMYKQKQSTSSD